MLAHENPFRSERVEALAFRGDVETPAELLARCCALGGRGALVGPKGSGKTTLLKALAEALATVGSQAIQLRLTEEFPLPDWKALRRRLDLATPRALLLDGAEQLGGPAWWRLRWLARRVPLLIVTTHRPGRLPTLRRHGTSPALLAELVADLLRGCVPALPLPTQAKLDELFLRHRGNLRECLRELYDQTATL